MIYLPRYVLLLLIFPCVSMADGIAIDKVYHPYVQPLEREIEWRMIAADGQQTHRLGIGKSLSDDLFAELYLIAEQNSHNDLKAKAYELELKWQLSEQGEFDVDWGLITELEYEYHEDNIELASALILEKTWGRWVGAANLWLIYEHSPIDAEFETAVAFQTRYRYAPYLEPAVEFYAGENTRALGPVLMGDLKFGPGQRLHWEAGVIFGLSSDSPDNTWRFSTEYEF